MKAKLLFSYAMCVLADMVMTRFWRPGWPVFVAMDAVICITIALSVIPNPWRTYAPLHNEDALEYTPLPRNGHEKPGN